MAAVPRALDVKDAQVLVEYPDDPVFQWHHRVLLHRIAEGRWVTLTPDEELQIHDLGEQRHVLLQRGRPLPPAQAAAAYIFDPIAPGVLADHRRAAKQQAVILGGGEVEGEEVQTWVVRDPSDDKFGTEVPEEIVADVGAFVALQARGVVDWDGKLRFIERVDQGVLETKVAEWKKQDVDHRVLPVQRVRGKRALALPEACAVFTEEKFEDWPFMGPRATKEFLEAVCLGPANLVVYEAEWKEASGIADGAV